MLYIAPAFGVLAMIYGKVLKVDEAVKAMTADMVWMIAGVLVVADALGKSGAGDAIGSLVLKFLGRKSKFHDGYDSIFRSYGYYDHLPV